MQTGPGIWKWPYYIKPAWKRACLFVVMIGGLVCQVIPVWSSEVKWLAYLGGVANVGAILYTYGTILFADLRKPINAPKVVHTRRGGI